MRKRSRDSLPGIFSPVLTTPLLAGIHQLNRDYVELLIAAPPDEQTATGLPASVIKGLTALPPSARGALAACSFALYSLGLEHHDAWRSASGIAVAQSVTQQRVHDTSQAGSVFAINALFFAWHVTHLQRVAARMFYAMPDFAIDALMRTPLNELQPMTRNVAAPLLPRWPTNAAFWPDLVRFAALGDERRLTMTQLLGSQLIAADLRANTITRSHVRVGTATSSRSALLPGLTG